MTRKYIEGKNLIVNAPNPIKAKEVLQYAKSVLSFAK
jgi:hypothetical protein